MKFHITTSPNTQLKGKGIDEVEPETTIGEIIGNIIAKYPHLDAEGKSLIHMSDKGTFARYFDNDPINQWYGGGIGDIFRITQCSTMRYRIVVKALPEKKSKKEKNKRDKFSTASAETYFKAHNSIIDMLRDRQGLSSEQTSTVDIYRYDKARVKEQFAANRLDELDIKGDAFIVNRRGKRMFVYYLDSTDDILVGGKKKSLWELVTGIVDEVTDAFNANPSVRVKLTAPDPQLPNSQESQKFMEYVEIIIIYNNENNATPITTKVPTIPYIQFFSVQSIPMSLPYHVEQPEFHLLVPKNSEDRKEIREMYKIHGMELSESTTVSEYALKSGSRLYFI